MTNKEYVSKQESAPRQEPAAKIVEIKFRIIDSSRIWFIDVLDDGQDPEEVLQYIRQEYSRPPQHFLDRGCKDETIYWTHNSELNTNDPYKKLTFTGKHSPWYREKS